MGLGHAASQRYINFDSKTRCNCCDKPKSGAGNVFGGFVVGRRPSGAGAGGRGTAQGGNAVAADQSELAKLRAENKALKEAAEDAEEEEEDEQTVFKGQLKKLEKKLGAHKSSLAHSPDEEFLKQLVAKVEGEIKLLRKGREEEMSLDDRLAKKLGQLKAAKGRVDDISKECDEHLATFKRQQEECLARIDKAQAMHKKEFARQTELEQEVAELRVAQAATLRSGPTVSPAPPVATLPTDPDAMQVLINALAGVVESCDDPGSQGEATKFREAASTNKSFLAILFHAIHIKQAAAERALFLVAPGQVGDQAVAARSAADEGMVRAPKRTADEAQLPEEQPLLPPTVPAVTRSRDDLVASLGLGAADTARQLALDDSAGVL